MSEVRIPEVLPAEAEPGSEKEPGRGVSVGTSGRERRLLSFYDRLRARVVRVAEKGRLPDRVTELLLLAPDLFMLMTRLSIDPQVPGKTRSLIGGALAYFVLPIDFMPEIVLGPGGFLDDIVLAALVLAHVMSRELEPLTTKYWSGSEELRVVLRDITRSADKVLGDGVYRRLQRWLDKRI